jgi:hypothetical protein
VVEHERDRQLDQIYPGLLGQPSKLLDGVELALVLRLGKVEALREATGARRRLLPGILAPAARQPTARQRAVGHDAQPVAQAGGQNVGFRGAHEDRVRGLLGNEALEPPVVGDPLGLDDLARRERGGAHVADLPLMHEVGERAQRFFDVGVRVGAMDLVEVDPVGVQPPQRILDGAHDPTPRVAPLVRVVTHRVVELGGEDDVLAAAGGERFADDLLGLALPVDVGGVDEVDAGVERRVDDPYRLAVIGVAPGAEHHRAEAKPADRDAGSPE